MQGIDLDAGYSLPVGPGQLDLRANATDLIKFDQALTPTSASLSRAGLVGFPARFRGRLTADWTYQAVTAGVAVNQTGALHDVLW